MKINEIIQIMEEIAPARLSLSWDNAGLLVGDENDTVTKILCALDCTDEVIREAIDEGANLIITHHPLLFRPISRIQQSDPLGNKIIKLIRNKISLYAAHTNFDKTEGGTNDVLAAALQIQELAPLFEEASENNGMGRTGKPARDLTLKELAIQVKQELGLPVVNYAGEPNTTIRKIALCTGSASGKDFFVQALKAGCQAYITGDIKFHDAQLALDMGLCLIDATHYGSEVIAVKELCRMLRDDYSLSEKLEIIESATDGQVLKTC